MLRGMFRRYVSQVHKQHLIFSQFEGMFRGYDSTYVSDDVERASYLNCLALYLSHTGDHSGIPAEEFPPLRQTCRKGSFSVDSGDCYETVFLLKHECACIDCVYFSSSV